MEVINDDVLEDDILPVIYQLLGHGQGKALFESAHAVVLGIFEAKKPVSRELACVYAKILIEVREPTLFYMRERPRHGVFGID